MAMACQVARAKLAQYVSSLRESSNAEKAGALIKAGYLGSAKTVLRNDLGNASWGGVEYLAQRPLAVAIDYLGATMKSAATFGRVKPHEFRQIANTLDPAGLQAGLHGIREGVLKAVQMMKTGIDADRTMKKYDLNETTFKSRVLDKSVKAIYNFMEASDKPFFGFAFHTSIYGRAKLSAIREGLKGAVLRARVRQLITTPTDEMILGATQDAEYATFKNSTTLGNAAASVRQSIRRQQASAEPGHRVGANVLAVGIDITIPFTRVASAITMAGIDYSPAGFARALLKAADKDPKVQAQLAQSLSRATIGTGLTMLGYSMFHNGTLTGSMPTGPGERSQWDLEGKQANSILLNGRWRSITFLGPLAIPLLLGANLRKFSESDADEGAGSKAAFAVGSIGKTMTEQSYLQGLSGAIDAMNDPSKGASAVAGMVPIPAIVGQAATAVDPVQRSAQSVPEKIEARIPFASRNLPARLSPAGDTLKKTPGGARGAAESFLDITNPKEDRQTELTRELDRLGVTIGRPSRKLTAGGASAKLSGDEYSELVRSAGAQTISSLFDVLHDPEYAAASDEEKRAAFESVIRTVRGEAREPFKEKAFDKP